MGSARALSPVAVEAARLLGHRVAAARRERRWTLAELAERVGVSVVTIRKVEAGDPTVALGTAFEAAALVGVALFHEDPTRRALEAEIIQARLAVLPASVRARHVDDEF